MKAKNTKKIAVNAKASQKSCAAKLKNLRPFVTAADRKAAMAACDISYITVSRYLLGQVANITRGIELANFFAEQIEKRETVLMNLDMKINPLLKQKF